MEKSEKILKFLEKRYGRQLKVSHLRGTNIFELLISTILSQRTRDENTDKASKQLFAVANTPEKILKLPMRKLQKLIRVSGPYKQKAKRIKQVSKTILEEYNGKVPRDREELMNMKGIGYKTSAIVMMYGFNIPIIAVDTHVNRIPKRMGLVDKKTNVEEVREKLESMFPKKKWYLINYSLVNFGKEICKPINPQCDEYPCPFKSFCRAYKTKEFKV
jgi:endonuclease-3